MKPAPRRTPGTFVIRPLRRDDGQLVERLFGSNGACGGCWCMWWRVERGGKLWERCKGEPNRRALLAAIERAEVDALLAFDGGEPIGWCTLGPRASFPRLERTKALRGSWDASTWSVPCFFIPARHRGRGLASALLTAAIEMARQRGAQILEGYPIPTRDGVQAPAAFAWTGVESMFERHGFERQPALGDSERSVWKFALSRKRSAVTKRTRTKEPVDALRNLGPVSRRWLADVGVRDVEELRRRGSVSTYLAVKRDRRAASLNLLYALEAALLDVSWTELPSELKRRLREAAGVTANATRSRKPRR